MTDDDEIRRSHQVTASDQRALVAQCTRCTLRDTAVWTAPGTVVGVVVSRLTGSWSDVVPVVVGALVLLVIQVATVRRHLRERFPVGEWFRTALTDHRLRSPTGDLALPHVTGVGLEGRVVRIDLGKDHTHLLPAAVDVEAVRQRAGVPAPEPVPVPGSVVVEVPPGVGARAALRAAGWNAVRGPGVGVAWVAAAVLLVLGQWAVGAAVVLWQVGWLVAQAAVERRTFERAFPPGVAIDVQWRSPFLELRSIRGLGVVDLDAASSGARTGPLFLVRRRGMPPLWVPDVVVTDDVRTNLSQRI